MLKQLVRRSMIILISFCLALFFVSGCNDSDLEKHRQQILEDVVSKYNVPGAVLAEYTPDGKSRIYAAGVSDLETRAAMATDMYFRIGSVTKTFTATAILMLAEDGLLSLDDTVNSILPDALPGDETITVKNLLMMRSGLSDFTENETFQNKSENDPKYKWTFPELASMVEVDSEPDWYFSYRNINYAALGAIIEKISGRSRAEFIQERICAPLGLKHTFIPENEKMPGHSASGYLVLDDVVTDVSEDTDPSWAGAAGDMISTAEDLIVWLKALDSGKLLSETMHKTMYSMRGAFIHGSITGYGCGTINVSGAVGHGGNYADYYTAAVYAYQDSYMVVLANGRQSDTTGDATDVFFDVAHTLYPPSENITWRNEQLSTLLSLAKDRLDVPGLTAQIQFDDKSQWTETIGIALADDTKIFHTWDWTGQQMTRDLHFRIASVSKSITAVAVMMLVDQGTLSLDQTLVRWLPDVDVATKDRITIRQLLNHTSGIPDYIKNKEYFDINFAEPLHKWTLEERIAYAVPLKEPGSVWAYSNTGYILLSRIIEQASGMSYGDFLEENIFNPLGMNSTSVPGLYDYSMPEPYVRGYSFTFNQLSGEVPDVMPEEGWLKELSVYSWPMPGGGNVVSTPDDTMRWLEALTDGRLLSEESNRLLHEYVKTDTDGHLYGLGIEYHNGYTGHDGDMPGYHTGAHAKNGILFTVLMNGDSMFGHGNTVTEAMGTLLGL